MGPCHGSVYDIWAWSITLNLDVHQPEPSQWTYQQKKSEETYTSDYSSSPEASLSYAKVMFPHKNKTKSQNKTSWIIGYWKSQTREQLWKFTLMYPHPLVSLHLSPWPRCWENASIISGVLSLEGNSETALSPLTPFSNCTNEEKGGKLPIQGATVWEVQNQLSNTAL